MRGFGAIQQSVEDLVLPHMMSLAVDKLYSEGFELRLDARGYLNNAIKVILRRHTGQELVVARKADDLARRIMREVDFDDAKLALLAISFFACKLVEEELYLDKDNQAVLTALMVIGDSRDDNPEFDKMTETAQDKAGKMLKVCLGLGMYKRVVVH